MDRPGPEEKTVSAEQRTCGRCGAKLDFAPFYADSNEEYADLTFYDSVK